MKLALAIGLLLLVFAVVLAVLIAAGIIWYRRMARGAWPQAWAGQAGKAGRWNEVAAGKRETGIVSADALALHSGDNRSPVGVELVPQRRGRLPAFHDGRAGGGELDPQALQLEQSEHLVHVRRSIHRCLLLSRSAPMVQRLSLSLAHARGYGQVIKR